MKVELGNLMAYAEEFYLISQALANYDELKKKFKTYYKFSNRGYSTFTEEETKEYKEILAFAEELIK